MKEKTYVDKYYRKQIDNKDDGDLNMENEPEIRKSMSGTPEVVAHNRGVTRTSASGKELRTNKLKQFLTRARACEMVP